MAIKGKAKTKARPRPVARAPRRAPVEVKAPLFARRWVQVTGAFVVGVLAMMLLVWVTNGLRQNTADSQSADAAARRRTAATKVQTAVENAIGSVGTVSPGVPPTVFVELNAILDRFDTGKVKTPEGAEEVFSTARRDAKDALKSLEAFNVSGTIIDQGFTLPQTTAFTSSYAGLLDAMELYGGAATVGEVAVSVEGRGAERLAGVAVGLRDDATRTLNEAWVKYQSALTAGGIVESGAIPGLGG